MTTQYIYEPIDTFEGTRVFMLLAIDDSGLHRPKQLITCTTTPLDFHIDNSMYKRDRQQSTSVQMHNVNKMEVRTRSKHRCTAFRSGVQSAPNTNHITFFCQHLPHLYYTPGQTSCRQFHSIEPVSSPRRQR